MIPELGHFSLILALFIAAGQHWAPLRSRAAALQLALCLAAALALLWSAAVCDLTLLIVAENSHTLLPWLRGVAGVMTAPGGLALLALPILSGAGLFLAARGRKKPAQTAGAAGIVLIAATLLLLHPFARLHPAPHDGLAFDPFAQEAAP